MIKLFNNILTITKNNTEIVFNIHEIPATFGIDALNNLNIEYSDARKCQFTTDNQIGLDDEICQICENIIKNYASLQELRQKLDTPSDDELFNNKKSEKLSTLSDNYNKAQNVQLIKVVSGKTVNIGLFPLRGDMWRDFQLKGSTTFDATGLKSFSFGEYVFNLKKAHFDAMIIKYDKPISVENLNRYESIKAKINNTQNILDLNKIDASINAFVIAQPLDVSIFG